jgi:DNA-binding FrmR family transcriptional regulator
MPPRREDILPPQTLNTIFEKLGGVEASVREAKHAINNASQQIGAVAGKVDALALVVTTQGQLREHVVRLEEEAKADRAQIDILKADKLRREGAIGLVAFASRNWPFAFFTLLMGLLVAWANGKLP